MFGKIKNYLTSYSINQIDEIKDRPKHCLIYRFFQFCISIYIIYLICKGKLYLKTDPPIPGAVRLTLQEPANFKKKPSYCLESSLTTNTTSCEEDKLPCVYWGSKEIQYPTEETGVAFFTTRASVVKYPPRTCNISASSPEKACILSTRKTPRKEKVVDSFIADIESYTVMIEHSIPSIDGKILIKNKLMNGQFLSADDKTVVRSWDAADNDPKAVLVDGDTLTMKEILDAAGADLSACSSASTSNRSSGIIIVIVIYYEYYENPFPISLFVKDVYNYKYKPRIIDDVGYKIEQVTTGIDGSFIIKYRHGIRFVLNQHGKIRTFSWTALAINVTASLYSYRVVSLIMDFSIRHGVDTWIERIYIWYKETFHPNRGNDDKYDEESVLLIDIGDK